MFDWPARMKTFSGPPSVAGAADADPTNPTTAHTNTAAIAATPTRLLMANSRCPREARGPAMAAVLSRFGW